MLDRLPEGSTNGRSWRSNLTRRMPTSKPVRLRRRGFHLCRKFSVGPVDRLHDSEPLYRRRCIAIRHKPASRFLPRRCSSILVFKQVGIPLSGSGSATLNPASIIECKTLGFAWRYGQSLLPAPFPRLSAAKPKAGNDAATQSILNKNGRSWRREWDSNPR